MINHLLTLLMNVDGDTVMDDAIAPEIVDPAYRSDDLPTALTRVRAVLFGADPDVSMLTYRCRQLLAVVHTSPMAEYVTNLDPRITYDFTDTSLIGPAAFKPAVTKIGDFDGDLVLYGDVAAPDVSGRMRHMFEVSTPYTGQLEVRQRTKPMKTTGQSFSAGDRITLAESGLTMKLTSDVSGQLWSVTGYGRPQRDIGTMIAAIGSLGEPTLIELFGVNKTEPFRTFRDTFNHGRETPLRLSAAVLALAYRTDALRG